MRRAIDAVWQIGRPLLPQFPVPFLLFRWLLLYCKFFLTCLLLYSCSAGSHYYSMPVSAPLARVVYLTAQFHLACFELLCFVCSVYICYSADPIRLAQCQDEVKSMQKCSLLCRRYNQFWQRRQQDVWIVVNNQAVYDLVFSYRRCTSGTDLAQLSMKCQFGKPFLQLFCCLD